MTGPRLPPSAGTVDLTVTDGDLTGVLVPVQTGTTVQGRVQPPGRATVRVEATADGAGIVGELAATAAAAEADENGHFELRGLARGTYEFTAEDDRGAVGKRTADIDGKVVSDVVINLETRGSVSGIVVEASGTPARGVRVAYARAGEGIEEPAFGMPPPGTTTADDGSFVLDGIEDGRYSIEVADDLGQLKQADPSRFEIRHADNVTGIVVTVEYRGERIAGTVLDAAGRPAADVWVSARVSRQELRERTLSTSLIPRGARPAFTDADGHFTIDGLRKGRFDVAAEALGGSARARVSDVETGGEVTLQLQALGSIKGIVRRQGTPANAFTLDVRGTYWCRRVVRSQDGRFVVDHLEAGHFVVAVDAGDGVALGEVEVAPGRTSTLELEIGGWATVTGRVVDGITGAPLSGLRSNIFGLTGEKEPSFPATPLGFRLTDVDGRFRIDGLGTGRGRLWFTTTNGRHVADITLVLHPGEGLDVGTVKAIMPADLPASDVGRLGFSFTVGTWDKRLPEWPSLPTPTGAPLDTKYVFIATVTKGSSADAAGLRPGDRVLAVDAIDVEAVGVDVVAGWMQPPRFRIGQRVELTVDRGAGPVVVVINAI